MLTWVSGTLRATCYIGDYSKSMIKYEICNAGPLVHLWYTKWFEIWCHIKIITLGMFENCLSRSQINDTKLLLDMHSIQLCCLSLLYTIVLSITEPSFLVHTGQAWVSSTLAIRCLSSSITQQFTIKYKKTVCLHP